MAMGCISELRTSGLAVPADISVMGFDDIRYAAVTQPPLTTIAQPARDIGEHTMNMIMRAIEGEDIGTEVDIVPHRLVIRESTAKPAAE